MKKIKFSIVEEEMKEHIIRSLIRWDWSIREYFLYNEEGSEDLSLEEMLLSIKDRAVKYHYFELAEVEKLLDRDSMELFIEEITNFQNDNDMTMLYLTLKNNESIMESEQTISDCFQLLYEDDFHQEEENVWRIFVNNVSKILENSEIDELKLIAGLSSPTQIIESLLNVSDKFIALSEIHTYNPYIKGVFQMGKYIVKFSINSDEVEYYQSETWNNYDVQFEVFEVEEE